MLFRRPAAAALILALAVGSGCGWSAPEDSSTLAVAAASDLRFALEELLDDYEGVEPGLTIEATYGSSGVFYTQLQNRAPFDLYLSADAEYPRRLAQEGLAVEDSGFLYAVGRIALWAPEGSAVDVSGGAEILRDDTVRRIAVANPDHAPYGRAAVAALESLGVYDEVEDKIVYGENVAQALQFAESGAADVGMVALSLALAPSVRDAGERWEVPLDAYPTMEQGGVVLEWAQNRDAAFRLRKFLLSAPARATLARYGFAPPPE